MHHVLELCHGGGTNVSFSIIRLMVDTYKALTSAIVPRKIIYVKHSYALPEIFRQTSYTLVIAYCNLNYSLRYGKMFQSLLPNISNFHYDVITNEFIYQH